MKVGEKLKQGKRDVPQKKLRQQSHVNAFAKRFIAKIYVGTLNIPNVYIGLSTAESYRTEASEL